MVVELPTALYMTRVKELCHGSRVAHSPLYDSCERSFVMVVEFPTTLYMTRGKGALSRMMVGEFPTALYMTRVKELCHGSRVAHSPLYDSCERALSW